MNTLADLWHESELKNHSKPALIKDNNQFTYGELGHRIRTISANLVDKWKVRKGDVVALLAPNSTEFLISYFAVVNIGGIVQPIDEQFLKAFDNELRVH